MKSYNCHVLKDFSELKTLQVAQIYGIKCVISVCLQEIKIWSCYEYVFIGLNIICTLK